MSEWCASKTQIAPWFLDSTIMSIDEFAQFVRMLDDCEHGIVDKNFSATSSYLVMDENDRLIGATSLRHYLTVEGFLSWGHIGYGVRPTERQKGYAVQMLKMMLEQAKKREFIRCWLVFMMVILVHGKQLRNAEELWKMLYI